MPGVFFLRRDDSVVGGKRAKNGRDVEVEPTTMFCSKRRFGNKIKTPESPKRQKETGSPPFEIPNHIIPEKPWTYDHDIRDKRGESMVFTAVSAPKRRLFF